MDDKEKALAAALDAYTEVRVTAALEAGRKIGIRDAYHCILQEAVRELENEAPVGRAHYETFRAALDHLRASWPDLAKK